ncbi:DUF4010 domain-containing protein [Aquabacterium sp.]|uniref:MgtC/SapB family protein n=1 Tax=Aquabacterium sp. TaxID=1872578 RepID=UPI0024890E85|nr:DUF4010 domain-containing protein [Aquabacterium sp.]MDI1350548.1 DUF4010 domain-containing protein [Aquabacterium sp.]
MLQIGALSAEQVGVVVALGAGMLIGLERERRKGEGPKRESAGLRTFMVAALLGVCAQIVSVALAAVALVGVIVLAALSYLRSRSDDPGLTTELALVTTALIGMLAVPQPELAAAAAVLLASLLAARERLHHFATHWLSEDELHDGLLLAALALVLMPLLPAQPIGWLGHLSPQRVLMLVIVILAMQAAGHVAQRLLGARAGLALSGLLGGFVSSTATISAMGSMVRTGQAPLRLAWCAAVLSMAVTWVQMLLMASVVAPAAMVTIAPLVGVGVSVPLLLGAALWRGAVVSGPASVGAHGASAGVPTSDAPASGGVLKLREALLVAGLLLGGAVLLGWAQHRGVSGLLLGTAVAALADAHAPMVSLLSMHGAGALPVSHLMLGLMVALSVNGVTRSAAGWLAGGRAFGLRVAGALLLNIGLAWAFVAAQSV